MKKFIFIGCALLLLLVFGIEFVREAENHSRMIQMNFMFRSLSSQIELWRNDEGRYPATLSELGATYHGDDIGRKSMQEVIGLASTNVWHDRYEYEPSTNGFTLTVTGPDMAPSGWFGKTRSIAKHYNVGEALKEFNSAMQP